MLSNAKETIEEFIMAAAGMDYLDHEMRIFEEGIVNSLFAIELMTFLEREFEIKIKMVDLDFENFQTINCIYDFVQQKKENNE